MHNSKAPLEPLSLDEGRRYAREIGTPFLSPAWEGELVRAFPYLSFAYFLYDKQYLVRLAKIAGRFSTVPFSDGGDVYALGNSTLSLKRFAEDLRLYFGSLPSMRIHAYFCSVKETEEASADLIDFRITLQGFGAGSVRKTLRHVIADGVPKGYEVSVVNRKEDVSIAYVLYLKTMRRVCAPALPFPAFAYLASHTLIVGRDAHSAHAAAVFLSGEKTSHYFLSMTDAEGKKGSLAHHILFRALNDFKMVGTDAVFLGGTRVGSSLEIFKEGWRGDPFPIYTLSASLRETSRMSPIRAAWKYIPISLLPWMSRVVGKYFL